MTAPQSDSMSTLSQEAMKTINGKLIIREEVGIEGVKTKLQDLAQKFETLDQKRTALQTQQQQETVENYNRIQSSFSQVERIYRRLLATTMIATVSFGVALFWMNINRSECSAWLPKIYLNNCCG
jgi:hypothetical protein